MEMETLATRGCIIRKGKCFFFSDKGNVPIKYDIETNQYELLEITNIDKYRWVPVDLVTELCGKIYGPEITGKYLCEYDLQSKNVEYYLINCKTRTSNSMALLTTNSRYVLIFDRFYGLTTFDTKTKEIKKIPYPNFDVEVVTGCSYNNYYLLFPQNGRCIFQYDFILKMWSTIEVNVEWKKLAHAVIEEKHLYLLQMDGVIIELDEGNKINHIKVAKEFCKYDNSFSRLCITNQAIILLPALGHDILIVNKYNFQVSYFNKYPLDFCYNKKKYTKYMPCYEYDNKILFPCRTSQYMLEINKVDTSFRWIKAEIESLKLFNYEIGRKNIIEKKGYLRYMLSELIKY